MIILKIVDICLVIMLLIIGIETIIKLKKSEGNLLDDVRKSLIIRLDIIMILTIVISIITTIITILINK